MLEYQIYSAEKDGWLNKPQPVDSLDGSKAIERASLLLDSLTLEITQCKRQNAPTEPELLRDKSTCWDEQLSLAACQESKHAAQTRVRAATYREVLPVLPPAPTLAPMTGIAASPPAFFNDGMEFITKLLNIIPEGSSITLSSKGLNLLLTADGPVFAAADVSASAKHLALARGCSFSLQEEAGTATFTKDKFIPENAILGGIANSFDATEAIAKRAPTASIRVSHDVGHTFSTGDWRAEWRCSGLDPNGSWGSRGGCTGPSDDYECEWLTRCDSFSRSSARNRRNWG
jgi:hypothetical protein